jgi:hypothetical protein
VVFLVGARRSGTNWLQRVLGAHPDLAAAPSETHLFSHGLGPLTERVQHGAPMSSRTGSVYMEREEYLDALRDFCDRLFGGLLDGLGQSGKTLLERTPWHVYSLDLIGAVYPDARVIHIVRDGRDVARSLMAQDWGPDDPATAADEWVASVTAARSASRALENYIEVRYEDLLADPRSEVTGLLAWLGLDNTDEVVEAALVEAGVEFNVDPGSRRVGTEKWRTDMDPAVLGVVERVAGPLLEQSGYPPSSGAADREAEPTVGGGWPSELRAAVHRGSRRRGRRRASDVQRAVLARVDESQQIVDRLLSHVVTGDLKGVADLALPSVRVRIVEGQTWEGRGPAALARLEASLLADPALAGRQIRGEIFPGLPTTTVVSIYRLETGETVHRILAVDVQSGRITGLTRIAAIDA